MFSYRRITFLACFPFLTCSSSVEYDFTILDPDSPYGSPYGGFSRATASRLANMPLKLPNFAQDLSEYDPFYTTMRDSEGRAYACRVYHEDELEPKSLHESMFEIAELKREDEGNNDDLDSIAIKDSEAEVVESNRISRFDSPNVMSSKLQERLTQLKGMCAQYHLDWWSYEWCFEEQTRQFHVHFDKDVAKNINNLEIQDVTSLGKFSYRTIRLFNTIVRDLEAASLPEEARGNINALAVVIDVYEQGHWCEQKRKPRMTEATLRCCTPSEMAKQRGGVKLNGKPVDTPLLAVEKIVEDSVCMYNVSICTPLLCADYIDDTPKKNSLESQMRDPIGKDAEGNPLDAADVGDMTVTEILRSVFAKIECFQSGTGGWWLYELCPGRHVRQFHEVNLLDSISGAPRSEVETDHILGRYNPDDNLFTKEDEWKNVVNTTKASNVPPSKRNPGENGGSASGNGAYYIQEYISGDICDHEDVTDSAIKAGEFGEGGIQRAATVKYSCGNQLEMSTKEDSTCHYIVDVTIPALCVHPFFKAPVSKQQIVKCLEYKD